MTSITLNNVTKRFGNVTAISGMSLTVNDGEFVVLLGPTGAGKTTTLRMVAGLEIPDQGSVVIGEEDVTRVAPAGRNVAFVFQQYSLYPHYSVFDNLAFPLKAPGRNMTADAIRKRVHEVAEMLRISSKLSNRATELSGGEMQRVSIGRALVREPNIFLMDEPLSSLDAKLREDLRIELKRIQRDLNATILYVTHDQLEALTMADRVGVLSGGTLMQLDSPRIVYESPVNIYAAQRLGSPQINLLQPGITGFNGTPAGTDRIGIRPEDLALSVDGDMSGKVTGVEHLGVETVVSLDCSGQPVQALLGGHPPIPIGTDVRFTVRRGAAIYFDGSGNRIENAAVE